jgi:hypothetical protein
VTEPLPALLDCKALQAELGVKRATAEAIMRRLEPVIVPEHRKVFVRRDDVLRALDEWTLRKGQVKR